MKGPLWQVLAGIGLLGFAGYELSTGNALVSTTRSDGYGRQRSYSYSVSRQADPWSYWGEVIIGAGGGLYCIYKALRGEAD